MPAAGSVGAVSAGGGAVMPDSVLGMVQARLDSLAPESRRILRAASVFGQTFWEGGIGALVGGDVPIERELRELATHELVTRNATSAFPGQGEWTFRHALVPNLPYFAVSWDYKWSTGYGHVIENMDGDARAKEDEDAYDVDEMAAGNAGGSGGKFDPNFARDIIRGVLEDLDNEAEADGGSPLGGGDYMRSFGKSKRRSDEEKKRTKDRFLQSWQSVDWTKMLQN